jgi:hypothetical protein
MTVYLVSFLPKIPYIHRIYMVLANPRYAALSEEEGAEGALVAPALAAAALEPYCFGLTHPLQ